MIDLEHVVAFKDAPGNRRTVARRPGLELAHTRSPTVSGRALLDAVIVCPISSVVGAGERSSRLTEEWCRRTLVRGLVRRDGSGESRGGDVRRTLVISVVMMLGAFVACADEESSPDSTDVAAETSGEDVTTNESTSSIGSVDSTAPETTSPGLPPVLAEGSGSGDHLEELSIVDTAAAVTFTHDGTDEFSVWDLNDDGDRMNLIVDTTGTYNGTRPLQWAEHSSGFEIGADGDWSYKIVPMEASRHEDCPFSGMGDDVVIIEDFKNGGRTVDVAFDGDTAFSVRVFGFGGSETVIDEVGPYEGTFFVEDTMFTWDIAANGGTWTIDCT